MLTILLMISMITISIALIGLILDDNKEKAMNQYCYNECIEGKHYKEKSNIYSIF